MTLSSAGIVVKGSFSILILSESIEILEDSRALIYTDRGQYFYFLKAGREKSTRKMDIMIFKKSTLLLAIILPVALILVVLDTFQAFTTLAASDAAILVDTLVDENDGSCIDGDCSLRDAIVAANDNDAINFAVSGTVLLSSTPHFLGQLLIDKSLTISGNIPITISGNNATRVFRVITGSVTFDGLTITNGFDQGTDCSNFPCGAGIFIQDGAVVTVTNSTLISNTASHFGTGIYNEGTVIINNSILSDNLASSEDGSGSGLYNAGTATVEKGSFVDNVSAGEGGGISNIAGNLTVNHTIFTGNSAEKGGAGIVNFFGESVITISNSTFSNNTAGFGSGIYNLARATIDTSTFSGNTAVDFAGGLYNYDIMSVSNSTIVDNQAGASGGGGISSNASLNTVTSIKNTIVSSNTIIGTLTYDDLKLDLGTTDSFTTSGNNLIGMIDENSIAFVDGTDGDQVGVNNPQVAPLADNGGETPTHALLFGSPAIDSGANCGITDQRGMTRPRDGDFNGSLICDIGAYEFDDLLEKVFLPMISK